MGKDSLIPSWQRSVSEAKRHQVNFLMSLKRITRLLRPCKTPQNEAHTTVQEIPLKQKDNRPNSPREEKSAAAATTDVPPCDKLKLHEIDHG
jgi:hypothetical protein